jgi:hypothetical protein
MTRNSISNRKSHIQVAPTDISKSCLWAKSGAGKESIPQNYTLNFY